MFSGCNQKSPMESDESIEMSSDAHKDVFDKLSGDVVLSGTIKATGWNGWYFDAGERAYLIKDALASPNSNCFFAEGALVRVLGEVIETDIPQQLLGLPVEISGEILIMGLRILECPRIEVKKLVEKGVDGSFLAVRVEGYFGRIEGEPGIFLSLDDANKGNVGEGTFLLNGAPIYRTKMGEPYQEFSVGERIVCDGCWVGYGEVYFENKNVHLLSLVYNVAKKEMIRSQGNLIKKQFEGTEENPVGATLDDGNDRQQQKRETKQREKKIE